MPSRGLTIYNDGRIVVRLGRARNRSALVFSVVGLPPLPLGWACEVGIGRFFSALGLWSRPSRAEIDEQVNVFEAFQGVQVSEWAERQAKYGGNGNGSSLTRQELPR